MRPRFKLGAPCRKTLSEASQDPKNAYRFRFDPVWRMKKTLGTDR